MRRRRVNRSMVCDQLRLLKCISSFLPVLQCANSDHLELINEVTDSETNSLMEFDLNQARSERSDLE